MNSRKYSHTIFRVFLIGLIGLTDMIAASVASAQPSVRREKLYDKLDEGIALLLAEPDFSTSWQAHRYDPGYAMDAFKQEVHFYYLTGLGENESNMVALLDGANKQTTLYALDVSDDKKGELDKAGFRVSARADLVDDLGALAERRPPVYLLLKREDRIPFGEKKDFPEGLDEPTTRQLDFKSSLSQRFDWMEFRNLDPILTAMRAVKDQEEIEVIRRAVEISSLGVLETLRSIRPGLRESELAGVSRLVFRKEGAQRIAYSEDLQSGPNFVKSFIEMFNYYNKLDRVMEAGELMLVDLSCEYNYFKTDVARTAPVSGKFTDQQRAIYDLYLVAYRAALDTVRPGVTQKDIALASVKAMKKQVPTLSEEYLKRAANDYIERHSSGAPLGHYVDYYVGGAGDPAKPLVPGQVFVIEPRIILPDLNNFRVTLEDMILVTEDGHEILSKILPMEAEGIERVMAEPGILDHYKARESGGR